MTRPEIQDFLDGQGLSPGRSNLEPDHLLAQLSAAADLARRERYAWAEGDFEQAKTLRAVQQEFLLAHDPAHPGSGLVPSGRIR